MPRPDREDFYGFHKAVFHDYHQVIEGRVAAEAPRPPVPFTVGNLQAVVFCGAVHIGCTFDPDEIARLIGSQLGKQIYLPCPFKHIWGNLHIAAVTSHSNKKPEDFRGRKPLGYVSYVICCGNVY